MMNSSILLYSLFQTMKYEDVAFFSLEDHGWHSKHIEIMFVFPFRYSMFKSSPMQI